MSAFDEAITAGFSEFVDASEHGLREAIDEVVDNPGFEERLIAAAHRAAIRYAEDELGHPPELQFVDEFDFFDRYIRLVWQVGGGSQDAGWCRFWWDHPAAVMRVRAMWHAYEVRRRMSPADADDEFIRTVGDHHMRILMGEHSPMKACQTGHKPSRELASAPIDEGVSDHGTSE